MTTVSIPKQQKAAIKQGEGADSKAPVKEIEVPTPGPDEVLVKINWYGFQRRHCSELIKNRTGLCASDKSLIKDEWAAFGLSMKPETKGIAGHEGAGIVVAVGDNMHHKWKVGDRAGIKWVWSTCGTCEMCTNGVDELHCPSQVRGILEP